MSLLDFPEHIIDDIYTQLDQNSIFSLKHSCKFFDIASNQYVFQTLYFFNDTFQKLPSSSLSYNYKLPFTMIPLSKLNSFTEFLSDNTNLLNSIESITFCSNQIDPSISKLLRLLIHSNPINLIEIKFDSPNNDFLFFLIDNKDDFANRSPNRLHNLYENDELNDNNNLHLTSTSTPQHNQDVVDINTLLKKNNNFKYQKRSNLPLDLKTLQLFSVYDIDLIKGNDLEFTKLEVSIQNALFDNPLDIQIIKNLSTTLKSLKVLNICSFDYVSNAVIKYVDQFEIPQHTLFKNLQTFTLTLSDKSFNNTFKTINSICFENLRNFEVKFNRSSIQSIGSNNQKIVESLNNFLPTNQLSALSIINLNNYNMLNDNIFRNEIYDDSNLCFALLNHSNIFDSTGNSNLKYLNICLNTFLTVVRAVREGSNSYKTFVVDDTYLERKRELFTKILNQKSLQTLIIPDFLFNWLPFLDIGSSFNTDYDKAYAEFNNVTSTMIIRNLYTRFKDFEVKSGLDILKNPINFNGRSLFLDFYLDKLAPIMMWIADSLPNLTMLNLGGVLVNIQRSPIHPDKIEKLEGVYDSWVFTNFPNKVI